MNENDQQTAQSPVPGSSLPYAASPSRPPSKAKRTLWVVAGALVMAASVLGGRLAMNALLAPAEPEAASAPGPQRSEPAAAPEPADSGRYRLAPPAAFQGLTLQDSGPRVDAIKQGQGPAKPGTTPVAVVYADEEGQAQLVVSGVAGRFGAVDPAAALDSGFLALQIEHGQILDHDAGSPAGAVMRCGTPTLQRVTVPLCMWADHSTLVTVTVPIENEPPTTGELAARTKALREAMQVPAS
ncbi:hypothetical protein ACFWAR_30360 [Streptomyces sp. NPDC059917]|uniref:hypothetical protein n=1 Tax=Streptomyces sp. NPDC059917 TaxID=3347002 RepID=UPI00364F0E3E